MTMPTTSTAPTPKLSALEKIKALQGQMEAYKTEGIAELKALITEKEQELADLHRQLAELTGEPEDGEAPKQRRKRSPNKPKDAPVDEDAQPVGPQAIEAGTAPGVVGKESVE
jgi:hypothetical protein